MANLSLTIEQIKELMDKMQQTNLGELKIKEGDFELKLEAKPAPQIVSAPITQQPEMPQMSIAVANSSPTSQVESKEEVIAGNVMKSPIVGTFYAAAAPDKPPFVKVGSQVKEGDVLFIIESMKLMNEIQSDFDGEVVEIKAVDGQGLEYGQPVMVIK